MPLIATDALRLLALAGVPAAAATDGAVGAALMLLVLGGCMVPRGWGLPRWLDASLCVTSIGAAWAALLDAYLAVPLLDLVVHTVLTGLIALVVAEVLLRAHVVPSPARSGRVAFAAAVALAVLWEVGEHLGHAFVDNRIQVGGRDTVSDVVAGVVGSALALAAWRVLRPLPLPPSTSAGTGVRVSVVIPVKDDAAELAHCLTLLGRQSVAPYEVVVVDNGSSDHSAEVARHDGARVVTEPRPGIPHAAASGYDAALGDVVARLDADSRPEPDWVERVSRLLAEDRVAPGAWDAVSGVGFFHDLPRGLNGVATWLYLGSYYAASTAAGARVPLWGSSMAMRRDVWQEASARVHRDADVHDDMDLALVLGPGTRIAFDTGLRADVSGRSLAGRAQRRRRMDRAWTTLRLNWAKVPPWERWQRRFADR